jgi:CheY-like chemotaxis protein
LPGSPPSPTSRAEPTNGAAAAAAVDRSTDNYTPPSPSSSSSEAPAQPELRRRYLVAEDNKINRKLLVSMLSKFGYKNILEAHDGTEAVRQMSVTRSQHDQIDVILMDLWMPLMDGYEATERILGMDAARLEHGNDFKRPTVLAVTADVTDGALQRAAEVGMKGYMTKPYKLIDLQRLITEYCTSNEVLVQASGNENGDVKVQPQGVSVVA